MTRLLVFYIWYKIINWFVWCHARPWEDFQQKPWCICDRQIIHHKEGQTITFPNNFLQCFCLSPISWCSKVSIRTRTTERYFVLVWVVLVCPLLHAWLIFLQGLHTTAFNTWYDISPHYCFSTLWVSVTDHALLVVLGNRYLNSNPASSGDVQFYKWRTCYQSQRATCMI